ncbi:MAG: penicillin-binding transpeptidase domain-containing protein [Lachnospiraceae bacterium]|nr:penicillin-binding transpeptidase domain-containing protein [Lachnospiraceae bacterium]
MKKTNPNPHANRNIMFLTYGVLAVFLGLMLYFGYFLQVKSEEVINNSYNARLDRFADRIVRGHILSNDGQVLAETYVDEKGEEIRVYPFGNLFTHVVGHSTKGKTGLESQGNFYLLTSHVNLAEQVIHEISNQKNLGDDLVTTLDVGLQQVAYQALGDRKGAVIAMEPDTGKILAMVSKPDYDPNPLSLEASWEYLVSGENDQGQLLNRATQGLYPPGSIFKIVTALEAVRENPSGYQDYTFDCSGVFHLEDYSIKCYHSTAHGAQNLGLAFANSCNGAFANLGLQLNLDSMYRLSEQLLFNSELPLPMAYSKSSYNMKGGASQWEILQTSIGQGTTQVTPMHMAMITSAIANGGTLMKPYAMDHVQNAAGEEVKKFLPSSYGSLMTAEESAQLNQLMVRVVTEGTGSALRDASYSAAGKTGSAEFEAGKETHAWFTGYAPAEDPQLVVTVIVEEGGSGGKTAAPIARKMFDQYLLR